MLRIRRVAQDSVCLRPREYAGRQTRVLRALRILGLIVSLMWCPATWGYIVHVVQQVEVDGVVVETIDETHDTTAIYTTSNAVARSGYIFTGWTTSTKQEFTARDDWGRAYEQVSFALYEPMTNTAHYVDEDFDSDGDGMPDGLEIYWYGNLDQTRDSDTDGDGIGFALELELGLNPHFADSWQRGLMATSAQPKFFNLVVRCEPEGTLFATVTNNVAPGVSWASAMFDPRSTKFAYWRVNGAAVSARDEFGRALDQVSFTMPGNDVEVVAVCSEDAEVRAGLYWYGDAAQGWTSDTDGDGLTLREEFELGTNPLFNPTFHVRNENPRDFAGFRFER